jgi:hypothetical protein
MTTCLSPPCGGQVVAETLVDGHCVFCGLHHRRPAGAVNWDRVVGPVVVTLSPAVARNGDPLGGEEHIDADAVRFKGQPLRIDVVRGTTRFVATVPSSRLTRIVARD